MITALDTSILLDLGAAQSRLTDRAQELLIESASLGQMIIGEVVYAELAVSVPDVDRLDQFLEDLGIVVRRSSRRALTRAGQAWVIYSQRRPRRLSCPACGTLQHVTCASCGREIAARQHLLADFLIAAHASEHADRLLTRDRGFYRDYFPELRVVS